MSDIVKSLLIIVCGVLCAVAVNILAPANTTILERLIATVALDFAIILGAMGVSES